MNKRTKDDWINSSIWDSSMSLFRDDFTTSGYKQAYRDCCQHYGYKARVCGGWIFWEFVTDYLTWKNQK